ncbi:hypothetical protein PR202_ga23913 [Eleusine coracana subsp. coracana]|uniref:Kinesin motor domain-containing protein n=1 Tax=Eleusine coracana subsp. coracana TaxID=191504 RepID=A0AAV5D5G5_ELECO|nr:hypothetical protein PR202_ga23913 [Eleusine coracana subsp. coracana]
MVMACIIPNMDGQSGRETMQSLPDTLSSLMGFNKYLTPTWVESVSHIIKELSPAKSNMEVMVQKPQHYGPDDTEPEAKVAMIQGNIRVFCRVRPFHYEDSYQSRTLFRFTLDESNVSLKVAETKIKQYKFDKVFNQCATQGDVFAEVEPVIKSALDGYNICIFAYGQTGSGKTYTMVRFTPLNFLSIKAGPDGGIEIENLVAVCVNSFQEVKRLYEVGTLLRSTASTMANSTSSRSHCISMTSDMNWLPSMQDDTECSLDTSECETKQVILSEHENVSQDEVISVTECQHAEPVKVQNKTEEMGIIDIESWIHQQIIENTGIYQSIRVLHIPEVTEHGTYDSSTTSSLHMEWTKEFKWGQNEDSGMNLSSPTHNIEDIKQTKAANQITTTEICTPPSEELSRNTERKEHKTERLAYHGSYRRSLKEIMENCIPKQLDKEAKADPSIQPEIRFQDKEDYIGNLAKFFRALRTTWIGALLGMGAMSLGLEEDFFQSLML